MPSVDTVSIPSVTSWKRYLELTKPKVVVLMLFTALVGMVLSVESEVPWTRMLLGLFGIALASASGAVINHVVDRQIDSMMRRTRGRPLPTGQVDTAGALAFAFLLGGSGMFVLSVWVNPLAAVLTFLAMIGYAVIYTMFLKHSTPQNIVWGGAAGAAPPLLGAAAITGEVQLDALLLFLIIFIWTPPHFWPLAIHQCEDYRRAGVPMLPVTHGVPFTKQQILIYSFMLFAVTLMPFAAQTAGLIYLAGAVPLGIGFILHAWHLYRSAGREGAIGTFRYSIIYLFALFAFLVADHFAASG